MTASPSHASYQSNPECLIVIFNLRHPDARRQLNRQRAALPRHSDVEALDEHYAALIIRPGWVSEPAATPERAAEKGGEA
jgi:hypothetical protein